MPGFIRAIDHGITKTPFIIFDRAGGIVSSAQNEHEQTCPQPGWVEHDPDEIWFGTTQVAAEVIADSGASRLRFWDDTDQGSGIMAISVERARRFAMRRRGGCRISPVRGSAWRVSEIRGRHTVRLLPYRSNLRWACWYFSIFTFSPFPA